jgi:hypothetical protein
MLPDIGRGHPEFAAQHFPIGVMLDHARRNEVEDLVLPGEARAGRLELGARAEGHRLFLERVLEFGAHRGLPLAVVVETLKGGHASVFGGADSEHRRLPESRTSRPRRVVKDDIVVPRRLIKYWRQRCYHELCSIDRSRREVAVTLDGT